MLNSKALEAQVVSGLNLASNPSDEHCRMKAEQAAHEANRYMLTAQILEEAAAEDSKFELVVTTVTV